MVQTVKCGRNRFNWSGELAHAHLYHCSCAGITKDEKIAKLERIILTEKEKQMIERERQRTSEDRRTVEKVKQKTVQTREGDRRAVISEQWTNDLNTEDSRRNTVRYLQTSGFTFEQILEYLRLYKKSTL